MKLPKGLFQIALADGLGSGISAIFWFYLASLILPEKYGEISYFLGIVGLVSYFALFGTQNSIIVYTAKNIKIERTFYTISFLLALVGAVVVGFYFNRIDISLLIFGYIINISVIGVLLGKKDFKKYFQINITQKILTLVLGLIFLYFLGEDFILYALVLSYSPHLKILYDGFRNSKFDLSIIKPRLGFILNNYFIGLIAAFNGQIDKLLIAPLYGFVILGNFSLALQIMSILVILPGIIYRYTLTNDASGITNKKLKMYTLISVIGITVLSIIFSPIIITEMFPKYQHTISAIQIMSIAVIPVTISNILTSNLLGRENSKFVIISYFIGLSTFVIGIIILGNILDFIGLAISYLIYYLSQAIFLILVQKKTKDKKKV